MGKIARDETLEKVANAVEAIAALMADSMDGDTGFDAQAQLVKGGFGAKAIPVGTQEVIYKETGISATHSGEGITAIAVDEEVFINAEHESGVKAYEFTFDGVGWKDQKDNIVELAGYGITVTGTPAEGDQIVIHETASAIEMTVLDHDYDTPVNEAIKHTMTLGMNNVFEMRQFDTPEALIVTPSGLTSGTRYYVSSNHGANDNSMSEDGDFGFTPTVSTSNVRYVRHTTMGSQRSSYSKSNILVGKFITYDSNFVKLEECTTDEGSTGTYLGTTTSENPSYKAGDNINYTRRNACGSGDWETSNIRQYLNAVGIGWWKQQTKFSFPPANVSTIKGFLTGIDPVLRAHMQKVKKTYTKHNVDGGGLKVVEDKVFLLGMTEVNLGANNGSHESSYGTDKTLKTIPYAYYKDAGNADRIKLNSGVASLWWLRGTDPSHCGHPRLVLPNGGVAHDYAGNTLGTEVGCVIG